MTIVQKRKKETNPPMIQIRNAFKTSPLINCPKPGMKKDKIAGSACVCFTSIKNISYKLRPRITSNIKAATAIITNKPAPTKII
jgi:hypothetical protein